MFLNKQSI